MTTDTNLIGTAEAGQILGKTARTVQRMVATGVLNPVATLPGKTGAHLFQRSEVERLASADDGAVA